MSSYSFASGLALSGLCTPSPLTLKLLLDPDIFSQRRSNETTLAETNARFSEQLANLQSTINDLELKLSHIHIDMKNKKTDYDVLETEITEYRLLLDGEYR